MATIYKEIVISAPVHEAWDAIRDAGEVHRRLAPGILLDARLDGDARVVTFANGLIARELLVTIDDEARRFAYASVGGRTTHHNASMQVFPHGEGTRFVWITDVLPDEIADSIRALVEQGSQIIKRTLEGASAAS
ncbi:MAG TPA: SRPBCC family protein [Gemmatimonadaceae bacterium]|nr:SRPBCC family protein [Gemmatimonadaceae bacterium]